MQGALTVLFIVQDDSGRLRVEADSPSAGP